MSPQRALRLLVVVVLAAFSAAVAVALGGGTGTAARSDGAAYARSPAGHITTLKPARLSRAAISWRGGPIATSTGETVTVRVSDALAPEQVTPEGWAEFMVRLVHGSELSRLEIYIAPLTEVQDLCGSRALGCYSRDTAVSIGETLADGTTPEDVVRHEYGHHIALYRDNSPWSAIDWGPKHWASAANVCSMVTRGEAFPGNEGQNYAQNPGEAWAEVYRLMDERKVGITTFRWQIVAQSFYPDEAALQAAERDVLQPWTAGQQSVHRRQLTKKGQIWWVPLATPLDGMYSITVTLPRGGQHEAALVSANRKRVIRRALPTGLRTKAISGNICGQRSLFVRVTQKGALGRVTVVASKP